jgi:hypothetical protein
MWISELTPMLRLTNIRSEYLPSVKSRNLVNYFVTQGYYQATTVGSIEGIVNIYISRVQLDVGCSEGLAYTSHY